MRWKPFLTRVIQVLCHTCGTLHGIFNFYAMSAEFDTSEMKKMQWKLNLRWWIRVLCYVRAILPIRFDFYDMIVVSEVEDLISKLKNRLMLNKCNVICSKRFDLQGDFVWRQYCSGFYKENFFVQYTTIKWNAFRS